MTRDRGSSAIPAVLDDPLRDHGAAFAEAAFTEAAFTEAEREALGLTGRLPAAVLTLDQQAQRSYKQLQGQGSSDLAKNVYLEAAARP